MVTGSYFTNTYTHILHSTHCILARSIIALLTKYFCISSEPQTLRKVAEVWLATAFARRVFPDCSETEIIHHTNKTWTIPCYVKVHVQVLGSFTLHYIHTERIVGWTTLKSFCSEILNLVLFKLYHAHVRHDTSPHKWCYQLHLLHQNN